LTGKTLLIGSGSCARRIANELALKGTAMIIATPGEKFEGSLVGQPDTPAEQIQACTKTKLLSCRGTVGHFELILDDNGAERRTTVEQIVIAGEDKRIPYFSSYGLTRTETVMALSGLKKLLGAPAAESSPLSGISSVVFLDGLKADSNPVICEDIMRASLKLRTKGVPKTYILTRNLKVGGAGLEKLYRETREAGVVYIKFTVTTPKMIPAENGRVKFEFTDEITGCNFRLTSDLTIIDEKIVPAGYTADLANILGLDTDLNGFAQGDNVHRLTVFTNRQGILVAGPMRDVQSAAAQHVDADNAVLSLLASSRTEADQTARKARINDGNCVRCLTCLRLCPHKAITVNARVAVSPQACQMCGICLAECPRGAISIDDQEPPVNRVFAAPPAGQSPADYFVPSITAFCCSRSAASAAALAANLGRTLPGGLQIVEVPCGGSVSLSRILEALKSHADGVMVLTCHDGNCYSERGNIYARRRVNQIRQLFSPMGLETGRLASISLAANMGAEFAQVLAGFEKQLQEMGPNRLLAEKL
jgi:coenzyme F420-reducing hydrogenase delta subunit/Pyruvate/2-oxoacid:ferredoxin oxidoreductase delta subunit